MNTCNIKYYRYYTPVIQFCSFYYVSFDLCKCTHEIILVLYKLIIIEYKKEIRRFEKPYITFINGM